MPTTKYVTADGLVVPGVTTILQQLGWNKNALLVWAWKRGKEGLPLRDEEALDVGSLVHAVIESHLKHTPSPEIPEAHQEAVSTAVSAFFKVIDSRNLIPVQVEPNLVSNKFLFGGTPDAIFASNGELVLVDWKTSSAIYPEHKIQVEAYCRLYEENYGQRVSEALLVRLGKNLAEWDVHSLIPYNPKRWDAFLACLQLYYLKEHI